ncbi:SpoIIE family protein phosphatase [Streptomyces sp. RerS4]|uniref:SpoIIE family protein phosphatase n=1 Tax=Streptomyces sp. RerS4 TaxID=2942449 RepID=UPI00201C2C10|nr:SpoIIE family protein phosphatase [Streptomyces sp. RerS4]UQW99684.1 SpoIIE family protein phosphatase [Streptomyces sp. RerS4]
MADVQPVPPAEGPGTPAEGPRPRDPTAVVPAVEVPLPAGIPSAGGLLDVLGVAAVVLDAEGRIRLWSPQATTLYGYPPEEALGRPAAKLLVAESHRQEVLSLFAQVMTGRGAWAGTFPIRHRDGHTVLVEFRNMRLQADNGRLFALGLASEQATLRRVERDLALSLRLVDQSPIGLAVLDTDLRYVLVNPALERINAVPAARHLGRRIGDVLPFLDTEAIEECMRHVMATGVPILDQFTTGRIGASPPEVDSDADTRADADTDADADDEHAWLMSVYRLDDQAAQVIGVAISVVDVTEQHRTAVSAARARRRLSLIADASVRIGTTLDLDITARELADVVVPEVADVATVDVLDTILTGARPGEDADDGAVRFRALALKAAYRTQAEAAADPVGDVALYGPARLVAHCARTGRPVLVPHVHPEDLPRIARDQDAARLLGEAGLHSYLAVPLIARGQVLGALDLKRARNPVPFGHDDVLLASELAAHAAVSIDNARWYQRQRHTALALQRHLLPQDPHPAPGLDIAYRYQPAGAADETGGDWFDVIPLTEDRTALVVGDVMGSGINAAAAMGQLRATARALGRLGLEPATVLTHLDAATADLGEALATCVYAVYDPHTRMCHISTAGHLPPVHLRSGRHPRLLRLKTAVPLGVGGVAFSTTSVALGPGDELVLYTDGLVETRDQDIDTRLLTLTDLLAGPHRPIEETCDLLLSALRRPDTHDDVALLIARTHP